MLRKYLPIYKDVEAYQKHVMEDAEEGHLFDFNHLRKSGQNKTTEKTSKIDERRLQDQNEKDRDKDMRHLFCYTSRYYRSKVNTLINVNPGRWAEFVGYPWPMNQTNQSSGNSECNNSYHKMLSESPGEFLKEYIIMFGQKKWDDFEELCGTNDDAKTLADYILQKDRLNCSDAQHGLSHLIFAHRMQDDDTGKFVLLILKVILGVVLIVSVLLIKLFLRWSKCRCRCLDWKVNWPQLGFFVFNLFFIDCLISSFYVMHSGLPIAVPTPQGYWAPNLDKAIWLGCFMVLLTVIFVFGSGCLLYYHTPEMCAPDSTADEQKTRFSHYGWIDKRFPEKMQIEGLAGFLYQTCVPIQKADDSENRDHLRFKARLERLKESEKRRNDRLKAFEIGVGKDDEAGPPPENRFGQRLVVMQSWSPRSLLACSIYGIRRMSVAKWKDEPKEGWDQWIEDSENCYRFADKWQWLMTTREDLPWDFPEGGAERPFKFYLLKWCKNRIPLNITEDEKTSMSHWIRVSEADYEEFVKRVEDDPDPDESNLNADIQAELATDEVDASDGLEMMVAFNPDAFSDQDRAQKDGKMASKDAHHDIAHSLHGPCYLHPTVPIGFRRYAINFGPDGPHNKALRSEVALELQHIPKLVAWSKQKGRRFDICAPLEKLDLPEKHLLVGTGLLAKRSMNRYVFVWTRVAELFFVMCGSCARNGFFEGYGWSSSSMVILVIPLVFLMVHLVTYCKCCARDSFKQARMQRSQSNMLADFHANRGLRTSWSSVYVTDRASFTELSLLDGEGARAGHFTSSLPPVEVPVLSIQSVVLVLLMLVDIDFHETMGFDPNAKEAFTIVIALLCTFSGLALLLVHTVYGKLQKAWTEKSRFSRQAMSGSASPLGFLMPANQNGEVTKARSTNLVVSDLGLLMKGDVVINELQAENEKVNQQLLKCTEFCCHEVASQLLRFRELADTLPVAIKPEMLQGSEAIPRVAATLQCIKHVTEKFCFCCWLKKNIVLPVVLASMADLVLTFVFVPQLNQHWQVLLLFIGKRIWHWLLCIPFLLVLWTISEYFLDWRFPGGEHTKVRDFGTVIAGRKFTLRSTATCLLAALVLSLTFPPPSWGLEDLDVLANRTDAVSPSDGSEPGKIRVWIRPFHAEGEGWLMQLQENLVNILLVSVQLLGLWLLLFLFVVAVLWCLVANIKSLQSKIYCTCKSSAEEDAYHTLFFNANYKHLMGTEKKEEWMKQQKEEWMAEVNNWVGQCCGTKEIDGSKLQHLERCLHRQLDLEAKQLQKFEEDSSRELLVTLSNDFAECLGQISGSHGDGTDTEASRTVPQVPKVLVSVAYGSEKASEVRPSRCSEAIELSERSLNVIVPVIPAAEKECYLMIWLRVEDRTNNRVVEELVGVSGRFQHEVDGGTQTIKIEDPARELGSQWLDLLALPPSVLCSCGNERKSGLKSMYSSHKDLHVEVQIKRLEKVPRGLQELREAVEKVLPVFSKKALQGKLDYFVDSYDLIKPIFNETVTLDEMEVKRFRERKLFLQEMSKAYSEHLKKNPDGNHEPDEHDKKDREEEKKITRNCRLHHMHRSNLGKAIERIEPIVKFLREEETHLQRYKVPESTEGSGADIEDVEQFERWQGKKCVFQSDKFEDLLLATLHDFQKDRSTVKQQPVLHYVFTSQDLREMVKDPRKESLQDFRDVWFQMVQTIDGKQELVTGSIRLETMEEKRRWTMKVLADPPGKPVILEEESLNIWRDYLEFNEAAHEVKISFDLERVPPDRIGLRELQAGLNKLKQLFKVKNSVTLIMANSDMVHCMKHLGKRSKWWYYWLGFQNVLRDLVDSI